MNLNDYFSNSELIIHAGGMGERWYEVNGGQYPKALTLIGKKPRPILDWVILPYVAAGMKHIYISLWHKADMVIEHCEKIEKNSDIKFTFLIEPEDKRLGRAGVIKYYLENRTLDKDKPKIITNASDILRVNIKEFVKFHAIGLEKGFLGTMVCSPSDASQFGHVDCDPNTKALKRFVEKPVIELPKGKYINTAMYYLDSGFNKYFLEIPEGELPVDFEKSNMLQKMLPKIRCFEHVIPFKSWIWFKTPKDYSMAKNMDMEKFLEISSVEKYLGHL